MISRPPSPRLTALREMADAQLTAEIKSEHGVNWNPPERKQAAAERDAEEFDDYLAGGGNAYASLDEWRDAI